MNQKINLHTHCTFCDGKNTAEEMVLSAIQKGFTVLGFSSHCIHPLSSDFYKTPDDDWHIPAKEVTNYVNEIERLKNKYEDRIQIFLGFEADYFEDSKIGSAIPDFKNYKQFHPDYLIGSVHFVSTPKGFYTVDHTAENVQANLKKLYTNPKDRKVDARKAVCDYFEAERQMLSKGSFNILGHADLLRKRNDILKLFDEEESWYKEQVRLTAKAAAKAGITAEINTGAIYRGCMDDVYPSSYMLEQLFNNKVPVCVNSDSHDINSIDFAFDRAIAIAKKIGYKELVYPVANKNLTIKL